MQFKMFRLGQNSYLNFFIASIKLAAKNKMNTDQWKIGEPLLHCCSTNAKLI